MVLLFLSCLAYSFSFGLYGMIFRFFISIKFPLETCAEPVEAGIVFQQIYNLLEILGCVKNSTFTVSFTSFFTHHFLRAVAYSSQKPVTINYQPSTINYQLSTINYQLSTINCPINHITLPEFFKVAFDDLGSMIGMLLWDQEILT